MSSDVAGSVEYIADRQAPVAETLRKYANRLFAEIAVRIVAFGLDMALVLFAIVIAHDFIGINLNGALDGALWAFLLIGYFAASWTSPLRATPVQYLFGLRVLHESGKPLSFRDAAIRSALLVAQWWLITVLIDLTSLPNSFTGIVAVALMVFVPGVTRHRQGIHDFAARSIVVSKRSIRSKENHERMLEFLADDNPESLKARRPSLLKIFTDAVTLGVPLLLMSSGVHIANQKDMYARVSYALTKTAVMQLAVESFYDDERRWPNRTDDLGLPQRLDYPDGGYFMLDDAGAIRIQFEERPELKYGSLLLVPEVDVAGLSWNCRIEGDIEERFVPGSCRSL